MHKESLALCISDVHIGKETPRYNLKKAQQAIERCATKLVAIADMLRRSEIRGILFPDSFLLHRPM